MYMYGAHAGMDSLLTGSISKYSNTVHTESEVYDINYQEKRCIVDAISYPYKSCFGTAILTSSYSFIQLFLYLLLLFFYCPQGSS